MALPIEKSRLLHLARRQLDLDEATYRDLLERVAGVRSSRDLDREGFDVVMAELARLGFRSTSPIAPLPSRPGMATPGQTSKIRALWLDVTDGTGTDRGLGHWLEKQFQVSDLRFLDRATAPKVITGLLGWQSRKLKARSSPAA